ncbi:MAG TPA: hypothetical protein VN516_03635, partial [Candidatus Baltobacteraceae bacterium]|nr:hypothetical protein [Candidatus Baltobacteraceae bacterium]
MQSVVRHIQALLKRQLQHLVPARDRPIDNLHAELARIVRKFFKFQKLELNVKRRILHFKCPRDFFVRNKLVKNSIGPKHHVSLRVGRFKLPAAMLFAF